MQIKDKRDVWYRNSMTNNKNKCFAVRVKDEATWIPPSSAPCEYDLSRTYAQQTRAWTMQRKVESEDIGTED